MPQLATICYIDNGKELLMLHRNKKPNDVHEGKWIGVGGKLERGETPQECAAREILEETGLKAKPVLKGVITFPEFTPDLDWYTYVFKVTEFEGELIDCNEGTLEWVPYDEVLSKPTWEGDHTFVEWLLEDKPFFSAKFVYDGDKLLDTQVDFYEERRKQMLLIKNGRVMDPKSGLDQVCDILVEDSKIVKIAPQISEKDAEIIDATGLVVAPGLVDIHVHFREPGQTHKEDIHTGALAAAAGGFTTVVMMANTNPTISDVETLQEVLQSAAKEKINVKSVATITKNFNGQDLTDFKALLEAGAVCFSDDGIPLESSKVVKEAMEEAKKLNTFISLHEEDPGLNGTLGFNENIAKEHFHICGATGVAEYAMIARDVMIAYATKAHVHIQHLSKEESVKVVEFAQGLGAQVTAEVAPQHFSKTEALLLTQGSNAKMNPPLRLESDRLAVIEGLKSGVISVIATDHAPHHVDEKNVEDITKAPSGMTGLETSLSLGLTYLVEAGELNLMQLLEKMTVNPAKLYHFEAGYLAENGQADITIFDDKADRIVDTHFASKAANSPFIGETLKGQVKYTICNGQIVYKN